MFGKEGSLHKHKDNRNETTTHFQIPTNLLSIFNHLIVIFDNPQSIIKITQTYIEYNLLEEAKTTITDDV